MRHQTLTALDQQMRDIGGDKFVLTHHFAQCLHRRVGVNMRGVSFQANAAHLPLTTQPLGELRGFAHLGNAISVEKAELAFEHGLRAFVTGGGQTRRHDAAFRRTTQMQPLDHRPLFRLREREQAGGQRTGNRQRMRQLFGVQSIDEACRNCTAIGAGKTRRMETDVLGAVVRSHRDTEHHLDGGNISGQRSFAIDRIFFAGGQQCRQHGRTRMRTGARIAHAVLFEGVAERAIGERRIRGVHFHAGHAKDRTRSACAIALRVINDELTPRKLRAVTTGGDGVDDAIAPAGNDVFRDVCEFQIGGELRQGLCCSGHGVLSRYVQWMISALDAGVTDDFAETGHLGFYRRAEFLRRAADGLDART